MAWTFLMIKCFKAVHSPILTHSVIVLDRIICSSLLTHLKPMYEQISDVGKWIFAGRNSLKRINILIMSLLRSEEHTSELQSRGHLVCRLLLEKKKTK